MAVLLEQCFKRVGIVVPEGKRLCARKLRSDQHAVVRQVIVDDEIIRRHQCTDCGDVSCMSADEGDRGLDTVELSEPTFELLVQRLSPATMRLADTDVPKLSMAALAASTTIGCWLRPR